MLSRVPFYPLLLAAYPVLLLYSNNLTEVEASEVVLPLLLVFALTAVALAVLSRLWHSSRRAAIVISVAVMPALSLGLIAAITAPRTPKTTAIRTF